MCKLELFLCITEILLDFIRLHRKSELWQFLLIVIDWMIARVKSRFNVPLDTIVRVMSDTLFPANLLASTEETETNTTRSIWKMLGPFATASRHTL